MEKQCKYDRDFKFNSINLYRESGKKMEEVDQNLGIPESTLYVWVQEFKGMGKIVFLETDS